MKKGAVAMAALSPSTSLLRSKPSTFFIPAYQHHRFSTLNSIHHHQQLFAPLSRRTTLYSTPFRLSKKLTFGPPVPSFEHPLTRFCCTAALSSGEAVGTAKSESIGTPGSGRGAKVKEFRKRLSISEIKGGDDGGLGRLGQTLEVMGWVRTVRFQSSVTFIEVNDGSCLSNIQCVLSSDVEGYDQVEAGLVLTGASISVQGIVVESQGSKQKVELKADKIVLFGKSDPSFPIQKKRVTREFLRSKAHLRPRTNTFGAVARVRNALAFATHKFFQENGFVWVSSPIITASDCEGAGEQFCVTTLIPSSKETTESPLDAIPKTKEGLIDWSQVSFFSKLLTFNTAQEPIIIAPDG